MAGTVLHVGTIKVFIRAEDHPPPHVLVGAIQVLVLVGYYGSLQIQTPRKGVR
jgi:hypothetical protein